MGLGCLREQANRTGEQTLGTGEVQVKREIGAPGIAAARVICAG